MYDIQKLDFHEEKMADESGTYEDYVKRTKEREETLTGRIKGITDPLQAISLITENEGINLKIIWESDNGYPFDSCTFCLIILPLFLGLLALFIASYWEPKMHGKELYDDYGNRIVTFPKMPIAYLQQSHTDVSAVRENRNSLAWLCHKWLISTADVVQELQSPYPLQDTPDMIGWGPLRRPLNVYDSILAKFRKGYERKIVALKVKQANEKAKGKARMIAGKRFQQLFTPAALADIEYIQMRKDKARILWRKLVKWSMEGDSKRKGKFFRTVRKNFGKANEKSIEEKENPTNNEDSYWSSSETFSSDSGRHWKSYKSTFKHWANTKRLNSAWDTERVRREIKSEGSSKQWTKLMVPPSMLPITKDEDVLAEFPSNSSKQKMSDAGSVRKDVAPKKDISPHIVAASPKDVHRILETTLGQKDTSIAGRNKLGGIPKLFKKKDGNY